MTNLDGYEKSGSFSLPDGRVVHGNLRIHRNKTRLELFDDKPLDDLGQDASIHGVLYGAEDVSLLDCVFLGNQSHRISTKESRYIATVFPHYIAIGKGNVPSSERECIRRIRFSFEAANRIFDDPRIFGEIFNSKELLDNASDSGIIRRISGPGENPVVFYYSGTWEILRVDTGLGVVSVTNRPSWTFPGMDGISLTNTVQVNIDFSGSISINKALSHARSVRRFLEIVAGHTQSFTELAIYPDFFDNEYECFQLYVSMETFDSEGNETNHAHLVDLPIRAGEGKDDFCRVLKNWLDREQEWGDARSRFSSFLKSQNTYSIDRVVGVANMFDILPDSANPPSVELPDDLQEAKRKARALFKALPDTPERNRVLSDLGRVGTSSLKHKVRHRAGFLSEVDGLHLPDLGIAIDKAIDCRNHYVHGSCTRLDYNANRHLFHFFIDTLEFVFATSDLIEAGWDMSDWLKTRGLNTHPFRRYLLGYQRNIASLTSILRSQC